MTCAVLVLLFIINSDLKWQNLITTQLPLVKMFTESLFFDLGLTDNINKIICNLHNDRFTYFCYKINEGLILLCLHYLKERKSKEYNMMNSCCFPVLKQVLQGGICFGIGK